MVLLVPTDRPSDILILQDHMRKLAANPADEENVLDKLDAARPPEARGGLPEEVGEMLFF